MSDQVLEAVNKLAGTIETKSAAATKELNELKTEFEKKAAERDQKITEFTAELEKKGATIGELQNEIKELKAKGGRMGSGARETKSMGVMLAEAIIEHKDAIAATSNSGLIKAIELKVVGPIQSSNLTGTGNNYVSYLSNWQDGMEPLDQFRFRSLVRTVNSETDFVRYPRANTPIGEGSFAKVAEGSTKPQVDRDYTMVDLTLQYMAGYAIVSRQSLRNITFLQSWLPTSLMEQLQDAEDTEFANTLVAAANGPTTTNGTKPIEKLVHYIRNLRKRKYQPTAIAVDPDVWSAVILNTESGAGFNLPNIVTVTADGTVRVLGMPVYPVNWLTGGRVIVGDWRKASIVQSEGLTLRQSDSHASIFTSNEIAFLLERSEGLAIHRTDAFVSAVL